MAKTLCSCSVPVITTHLDPIACERCGGKLSSFLITTGRRTGLKDLLDLFVIALDVGPEGAKHVAYFATPNQWDGSWYTTDFNEVRTYRRAGNAKAVIASHGAQWAHLNPRVVRVGDIP